MFSRNPAKEPITAQGLLKLTQEIQQIIEVDLPRATKQTDFKKSAYIAREELLQQLHTRLDALQSKVASVEVVDPSLFPDDGVVRFGSKVTLLYPDGRERSYILLGPIEANFEKGIISYLSPVGSELIGKSVGESIYLYIQGEEEEIEIVSVTKMPISQSNPRKIRRR